MTAYNQTPTKQYSPPGMIPDDLSVNWYLHYLIGMKFQAHHAVEITVREMYEAKSQLANRLALLP